MFASYFYRRLRSVRLSLALSIVCCCAILHVAYEFLLHNIVDDNQQLPPLVFSANNNDQCWLEESDFSLRNTRLEEELTVGMKNCPTISRPQANTERTSASWQRQETTNSIIIAYSAFYDDRPVVGLTPWIRIQGVASLPDANATIYCHIWFSGCSLPYVTQSAYIFTGRKRGYILNNKKYVQYMFSCRLPGSEPVPSHVSLVAADMCSNSAIYLPVEKPVRSEPDHEFGVCVAISFGSVPTEEFVEWIELNRLLGVTEINIYDAGMVNMSTVFDYYTKQGILKVHPMPPPVPIYRSVFRSALEIRLKVSVSLLIALFNVYTQNILFELT
jgi:Glycosyltransferase family 92